MDIETIIFLMKLLGSIFLFPIKDRRPRQRSFPLMTITMIVINVSIHIWVELTVYSQAPASPNEPSWLPIYPFMEVSQLQLSGQGLGALASLTSFFLHANISHLLGNMFFLWFFGRKVEDATGSWRFGLFYLLCGFGSSFVSILANAALSPLHARIPGLGASGAISGLLGAYLFLYSDQKILTLVSSWLNQFVAVLSGVCFIALPIPFWLPAWVYLVYYLLSNVLLAQLTVEAVKADIPFFSGIGVFAHLGGAATGLLAIFLFLHPEVLAQRR
ncbi:MAG: rhomboid family intramembrane serine protease [Chloroflexota bacterium]